MLDRLPVEVVSRILKLGAPVGYTPSLYKERRRDIASWCLVSKLFCARAQPLLVEIFEVKLLALEDVEWSSEGEGGRVFPDNALLVFFPKLTELRVVTASMFLLNWLD
ncbi:hypothetical protein JCM8547_001266 [Rhodosporidiobolus lusitaniae]